MKHLNHPADSELHFLELAEGIRGVPSLLPHDFLEKPILTWIAWISHQDERVPARDRMAEEDVGLPATVPGRLKSLSDNGWIM